MEQGLSEGVLENYRRNLDIWEENIRKFEDDPENTPADSVVAYVRTKAIVSKEKTQFSAQEELELLSEVEKWYADRGLPFPDTDWLKRQREKHKQLKWR